MDQVGTKWGPGVQHVGTMWGPQEGPGGDHVGTVWAIVKLMGPVCGAAECQPRVTDT